MEGEKEKEPCEISTLKPETSNKNDGNGKPDGDKVGEKSTMKPEALNRKDGGGKSEGDKDGKIGEKSPSDREYPAGSGKTDGGESGDNLSSRPKSYRNSRFKNGKRGEKSSPTPDENCNVRTKEKRTDGKNPSPGPEEGPNNRREKFDRKSWNRREEKFGWPERGQMSNDQNSRGHRGRPTKKNYLEAVAESKAAREDKMVLFDSSKSKNGLGPWLAAYSPIVARRSEGIGWIGVKADAFDEAKGDTLDGYKENDKVRDEWNALTNDENVTVDYKTIKELAKKHNITGGKWIIQYSGPSRTIESQWSLLATSLVYNELPAGVIGAKVSPLDDTRAMIRGTPRSSNHVVCVYNRDFTDDDEVFAVEKALRGLKCHKDLLYKPNVYSCLDIYKNNAFGLRPTIYSSKMEAGRSVIESVIDLNWSFKKSTVLNSKLDDLKLTLSSATKALDSVKANLTPKKTCEMATQTELQVVVDK